MGINNNIFEEIPRKHFRDQLQDHQLGLHICVQPHLQVGEMFSSSSQYTNIIYYLHNLKCLVQFSKSKSHTLKLKVFKYFFDWREAIMEGSCQGITKLCSRR